MLTAIEKKTQKRIVFDDYVNEIEVLRTMELIDPLFFHPVFARKPHFRKESLVRGHFVSQSKEIEVESMNLLEDDDYFVIDNDKIRINESYEHMEGKKEITNYFLKEVLNEYENLKVEYEYRVYIESKDKYRIIDSAIIFPCGSIIALECQLSAISIKSLLERIRDYDSLNIDSVWFLGKQANTQQNRNMLYSIFGEIPPTLAFE